MIRTLVMTRRFYGQLQAGAMMSMSRREADNARAANEVNLRVMIAEPSNKKGPDHPIRAFPHQALHQ
jgi:hypothetical protein